MNIYLDRIDAGERLAREVLKLNPVNPIVFGVPRGGVMVADRVAEKLACKLDIVTPCKIGAPFQPEFAVGAICVWGNETILNTDIIRELNISSAYIKAETKAMMEESARRLQTYRKDTQPPDLTGKTAVVVDDGIATGYTARATLKALRSLNPHRLIFAVPVGAIDSVNEIKHYADEVVCPLMPPSFYAVGAWYEVFDQTTDAEVIAIMRSHWQNSS